MGETCRFFACPQRSGMPLAFGSSFWLVTGIYKIMFVYKRNRDSSGLLVLGEYKSPQFRLCKKLVWEISVQATVGKGPMGDSPICPRAPESNCPGSYDIHSIYHWSVVGTRTSSQVQSPCRAALRGPKVHHLPPFQP